MLLYLLDGSIYVIKTGIDLDFLLCCNLFSIGNYFLYCMNYSELIIFAKNHVMFSQGQIIFGICFAIAFIIFLTIAYRKDLKLHRRYYKGSFWILLAFLGFIAMIAAIKFAFI